MKFLQISALIIFALISNTSFAQKLIAQKTELSKVYTQPTTIPKSNGYVIFPTPPYVNTARPCYITSGNSDTNSYYPCTFPTYQPTFIPTNRPCYPPYQNSNSNLIYPCSIPTYRPSYAPTYRPCYRVQQSGSILAYPCNFPPTPQPPYPTPRPTVYRTSTPAYPTFFPTVPVYPTKQPQPTFRTPVFSPTPFRTQITTPVLRTPIIGQTPTPLNTPDINTPTPLSTISDLQTPTGIETANSLRESLSTTYIMPHLNCVYNMGDGSYTAYFGYENFTSKNILSNISSSVLISNTIYPADVYRQSFAEFNPGRHEGVYAVRFNGEPIVWNLTFRNGSSQSANANKDSASCSPIQPVIECLTSTNPAQAVFGYQNDNPFPVQIPIGNTNNFVPGTFDRSQPEVFYSGRVNNVFTTPLSTSDSLYWRLGHYSAYTNTNPALCSSNINNQTLPNINIYNNQTSVLGCSEYSTTEVLTETNHTNTAFYELIIVSGDKRAIRKAGKLLEDSRADLLNWPKEIINCADLQVCERQDLQARNQATIEYTNELYSTLASALRKARKNSIQAKRDVALARRLNNSAREIMGEAPRFSSVCR